MPVLVSARREKGNRLTCQRRRADMFPSSQTYSVLVLSHGGRDLENTILDNWIQAASVYMQVVKALSDAEKTCQFEASILVKERNGF